MINNYIIYVYTIANGQYISIKYIHTYVASKWHKLNLLGLLITSYMYERILGFGKTHTCKRHKKFSALNMNLVNISE